MNGYEKAEYQCDYHMARGWWCSRHLKHSGPCALRPNWWNFTKFARMYRNFERNIGK